MSPSFRQAFNLNNQAVNALLSGNKKAAIQGLAISLKIMKAVVPPATALRSSDAKRGSTNNNLQFQRIPIPCCDETSYNNTVVYNEAIQLPATLLTSPEQQLSMAEMKFYTGVMLYNFALSYQLIGTHASLCKAEKLYCLVLKAFDETGACNNNVQEETVMIVTLGCINNLSQIRYSNGDYEGVQDGLSHLSYIMTSTQQEESVIVRRLLLTALLLKPPSAASAA